MDQPKLQERLALRLGDASWLLESWMKLKVLVTSTSRFNLSDRHWHKCLKRERNIGFNLFQLYIKSQTSSYEARAEAAYLIAQRNTSLGTWKESMILWSDFMEDYPDLAKELM